jgi:glycosyltransferase involved in cell wall biosynthesis
MLLYYRMLLPELARLGHDVRVLVSAPASPAFPAYERDGVAVASVPEQMIGQQARRFEHLGAAPRLRRYLGAAWAAWEVARRDGGVDLVEAADWGLLFAPWIAEADGVPVSVTLHGSAGQIDLRDPVPGTELEAVTIRLLETALLNGADDLVTYSRANGAAWTGLLGRPVRVIPPPLRVAAPAAGDLGGDARGLAVGRVQHWKGPHVLCEALRRVRGPVPGMDWVGRDMPYRTHRSMSRMLGEQYPDVWGSRLVPRGARTAEETAALESRAAFVVVPSLWDVFNLVTAEALAFERVVIVSSGAGASELVTHGEDGFVCPAGEAEPLAALLETVSALPEAERRAIGRRGRAVVERDLDPGRIAARRVEAYAAVLARGPAAGRAPVSDWVRDAVRPGTGGDGRLAFLDHVALRDLATHARARLLGRIRGRAGSSS